MSDPAFRRERLDIVSAALQGLAAVFLVIPIFSDASRFVEVGLSPRLAIIAASAAIFLSFGLTCWRAGREKSEADDPSVGVDLEPLLVRLDRIISVLEARPPGGRPEASSVAIPAFQSALSESRWGDADEALAGLGDDADTARLSARLVEAKGRAASRVRAELSAAMGANDPARSIELRDALVPLLTDEDLRELDANLVKWLLAAVMKRLRTGTVGEDVASLAATVAERFGHMTEGASLRASLPTLRRSAGLCPRCARPYRGIADACPACLKSAKLSTQHAPPPAVDPGEEDDPIPPSPADPLDSPWVEEDSPD